MAELSLIPPELAEEIILFLDPIDVASVAQTSSSFRTLIYFSADQHLWRALYLIQPLDDPRACVNHVGRPASDDVEWKEELQRIIRARAVLANPSLCKTEENLEQSLCTLVQIMTNVPSTNTIEISRNLVWLTARLTDSPLLGAAPLDAPQNEATKQLIAQLHVYYGLTVQDLTDPRARVRARSYVFNFRSYGWASEFGPFMHDESGCVNWVHMQAVHAHLSMHIVPDAQRHAYLKMRLTQPSIPVGMNLNKETDWAGIAGRWQLSFIFCDHSQLIDHNNVPAGTDPSPAIFEDPEFFEVYRSFPVELTVLGKAPDPHHPTRPKIYFTAKMGGAAMMNGYVAMTPDGEIRWSYTTGEGNHATWSSQGVQVGGVRSEFGVFGSWTTTTHTQNSPVGSWWMKRIADDEIVVDPFQ